MPAVTKPPLFVVFGSVVDNPEDFWSEPKLMIVPPVIGASAPMTMEPLLLLVIDALLISEKPFVEELYGSDPLLTRLRESSVIAPAAPSIVNVLTTVAVGVPPAPLSVPPDQRPLLNASVPVPVNVPPRRPKLFSVRFTLLSTVPAVTLTVPPMFVDVPEIRRYV